MNRIRIILDAFNICTESGIYISNSQQEREAFEFIDNYLSKKTESDDNRVYVIKGFSSCRHFASYRSITNGITCEDVTPRGEIKKLFHRDLPEWLNNYAICKWDLLTKEPPTYLIEEDWCAIIAEWLIPGITKAHSISKWLVTTSKSEMFPANAYVDDIKNWIVNKFETIASKELESREAVRYFVGKLSNATSPNLFAAEWIRRIALLPVLKPGSPLRIPSTIAESVIDLQYAQLIRLELTDISLDGVAISRKMRKAIRNARLDNRDFTETVLALNLLWDGVAEELDIWLKYNPNAMTNAASKHLSELSGTNKLIRKLIEYYSPTEKVPTWTELDEGFNSWINKYSRYIRKSFLRRELPDINEDPAIGFSQWLKKNSTASFHPEKGYRSIANDVQQRLSKGQTVIFLMIDALSIHIIQNAISITSDRLHAKPTNSQNVFTLIPTKTDVCKNSVLTGLAPKDCSSSLKADLMKVYGLEEKQLVITSSWDDAERVQINEQLKLLIYRNNRIDELLHTAGNYRNLIEECESVFNLLSKIVEIWVADCDSINKSKPFVLLTSDHGFTYGPPPGTQTESNIPLDGKYRSVSLSDDLPAKEFNSKDYTYINKSDFKIRNNYLVARGRNFGVASNTLTGWSLSHGGLLPEEVIIPVVSWFGDEAYIPWPKIDLDEVIYDRDRWLGKITLSNNHNLPIIGGQIAIRSNTNDYVHKFRFGLIEPGEKKSLDVDVVDPEAVVSQDPTFDIKTQLFKRGDGSILAEKHDEYIAPRKIQLEIRTNEQDEFDNMF